MIDHVFLVIADQVGMRRGAFLLYCCVFFPALIIPLSASAWGSWGHQHINRAAVFALPSPMQAFFYNHIDYLTEAAVGPDLRKFLTGDHGEAHKHFIDLEDFPPGMDSATAPHTLKEAQEKYGAALLQKSGILPWEIEYDMEKLTEAFRKGNKSEILFLAADLGHYLGDACVPLHTTVNYDGQETGQKGIHAFWESQVPELFGSDFNLNTGTAHAVGDVHEAVWQLILHSHSQVDTVLAVDQMLGKSLDPEVIYQKDSAGNILHNKYGELVHSPGYARAYDSRLHHMAERQLRASILTVADFWYTAWMAAGKPDLSLLDPPTLTRRNAANRAADLKQYRLGKITGLKSDAEY